MRRHSLQCGSSRGFTLLELLIALAIIGIVFGVLAMTQVTTLQVTSESRRASDATEFANRELEQEMRTILADFAARQIDCAVGSPCTREVANGRLAATVTSEVEGTGYLEAGLIRITVVATAPAAVEFSRVVSCMDVDPPPSIALPSPCPDPL
jgi:prepilin-type N-terminal cleavage/methylation domain-containing protein